MEPLIDATALKSEKQTFELMSKSVINGNTVAVKAVISNEELEEGYSVKEIGIYAEDPDDGEILYALTTAKDGQWDYLPAFNNLMPSTITVEFYIEVSNADQVEIKVSEGTYALAHTDIRQSMAAIDARTALLELIVNTDITGNPFSVTFDTLSSVTVTGVHNTALQRIEF